MLQAGSDDSDVVITHVVSHPDPEPMGPLQLVRSLKGRKKIGEDDEDEEEEGECVTFQIFLITFPALFICSI